MRNISVRSKITIWYSALFVAILIIMMGLIYTSMDAFMEQMEEHAIMADSDIAAGVVEYRQGQLMVDDSNVDTDLLFAIYDLDENIIYNNKPRGLSLDPKKEYGVIRTVQRGDMAWDFYDARITENGVQVGSVRIVRSRTFFGNILYELLLVMATLIPIYVAAAVLGGRYLVQRAFKPIDDVRNTARKIRSGDMSQRIDIRIDDEFGAMSRSINDMLEHIEESYAREKQFSADISHELKTPLAIIIAHAENALHGKKTEGEYREALQTIHDESKDLAVMVNDFLKYSRLMEKKIETEKTDFSMVVSGVVQEMQVLHEDAAIQADMENNIIITADQMLLTRMVINLLDNAIKHGYGGGRIKIKLYRSNEQTVLSVINSDKDIEQKDLDEIFKRRFTAPKRNEKGYGIGLSVVKWIVDMHGGSITAERIDKHGVEFKVVL